MYNIGKTIEQMTRLVDLVARVRVNIFRLTQIADVRYVPYEIGGFPERDYVIEEQLQSDAGEIRSCILNLLDIYSGCPPQSSLEIALTFTESVVKTVTDARNAYSQGLTLRETMKGLLGTDDQTRAREAIAWRIHELQPKIQMAMDEITQYVREMMPIVYSKYIQTQIRYDLVRNSPQSAVQLAFALFEDHLRNKVGVGPETYGEDLINTAFAKDGRLVYSPLPAEQLGARNLCSGAYATLRNPRMHRLT